VSGSVNKCILVGNLTRDPEVRAIGDNGDRVAKFSLATNETWTDKQSRERRERTEYHNIVIYNENLVRLAENHLRKGQKIFLEGQVQTRKWQDNDGHDRYITEIVLQKYRGEIVMLSRVDGDRDGENDADGGNDGGNRNDNRGGRSGGRDDRNSRDDDRGGQRGRPAAFDTDLDQDVPF